MLAHLGFIHACCGWSLRDELGGYELMSIYISHISLSGEISLISLYTSLLVSSGAFIQFASSELPPPCHNQPTFHRFLNGFQSWFQFGNCHWNPFKQRWNVGWLWHGGGNSEDENWMKAPDVTSKLVSKDISENSPDKGGPFAEGISSSNQWTKTGKVNCRKLKKTDKRANYMCLLFLCIYIFPRCIVAL